MQELLPNSPDHAQFDAHFIRALAQEGYSRWYLRPKIDSTTMRTQNIKIWILAQMKEILGVTPSRVFGSHFTHELIFRAMNIHLEVASIEDSLQEIRSDLITIAKGNFILSTSDPNFSKAKFEAFSYNEGGIVEVRKTPIIKATTDDKSLARLLAGNIGLKEKLEEGRLLELLNTMSPNFLSVNHGACIRMAHGLREDLHKAILNEREFTPELRLFCAEKIFDLWNKVHNVDTMDKELDDSREETGVDPYTADIDVVMNRFLNPALNEPTLLAKRLAVLEHASFAHALEGHQPESERLSAMWEAAFPSVKKCLCDAPSNLLAYLCSTAAGRTLEKFRDVLGPLPT